MPHSAGTIRKLPDLFAGMAANSSAGNSGNLERSTSGKIVRYRQRGEQIYPAPTLQEVMAELPSTTVCGKEHHSDWYVSYWRIGCVADTERKGAATAALKLWLAFIEKLAEQLNEKRS
jgi:hypothetical protein